MNNSSPANSSISATATMGGGGGNGSNADLSSEDLQFAADLMSAVCKYDTLRVLKEDVMADLNKVVQSLDEDSWMFEGPISRINLVSKKGGFLKRQADILNFKNTCPRK